MLPIIDRSLIGLFSGLILSYLESNGFVAPAHHNDNLAVVQAVVGGIVGAITIVSFYAHHTAIQQSKDQATENRRFPLQQWFNTLKGFVIKQKTVVEVPPAEPEVAA